ncbi:MAG: hypothetical protein U5N53_05925 [Mycobacterium sp.]|nr:hypothetical protein [Mycobacterium sp.]
MPHSVVSGMGSMTYNNFLLQVFQMLFISNKNIFKYLKIRINSTLEKNDLEYRFLVNVQNVESFQRVEIQPILTLIESYFIENEHFIISDLIDEIGEAVEAGNFRFSGFCAGIG